MYVLLDVNTASHTTSNVYRDFFIVYIYLCYTYFSLPFYVQGALSLTGYITIYREGVGLRVTFLQFFRGYCKRR